MIIHFLANNQGDIAGLALPKQHEVEDASRIKQKYKKGVRSSDYEQLHEVLSSRFVV